KDADVDITLKGLQGYSDPGSSLNPLTEKQREVLQTAYDLGYYDVPRDASTKDIAEELGVNGSTVSEHLQRAERNLLSSILDS
ncbi:MAG: helix-turn-helix domain-containing protein, partial [Halobacteria archaeon]|nr:helix-turn-helix domain-containing protein [Halobacteria archaeon]